MARTESFILELEGVHARYGNVPALSSVSLNLAEGEIVTLLGGNGAGKTSTLNSIYGILPPIRGEVKYRGADIRRLSPQRLVRQGLCLVPEGGRIFGPLSVMDNLILGSYSRRGRQHGPERKENLALVFSLFPVLSSSRKRRAETLSGGERQMLALGRALMSSPRLLLLDEPSLGLAPLLITELMQQIGALRSRGLSVLLVEQNARAALKIADRGYIIEGGRISIQGSARELLADERVAAAYLGRK